MAIDNDDIATNRPTISFNTWGRLANAASDRPAPVRPAGLRCSVLIHSTRAAATGQEFPDNRRYGHHRRDGDSYNDKQNQKEVHQNTW